VFPTDQLVYLRILREACLGVRKEPLLDVSPTREIQMQVVHCRLHGFMSQAVSDIGCGEACAEHIDRTGVPEAVRRAQVLEPFRRQGTYEILLAEAVDAVPGQFLPPLIDKDAVSVKGLGPSSVSVDVAV